MLRLKKTILNFSLSFPENLRRHEAFIAKKLFAFHETCAFRIEPGCPKPHAEERLPKTWIFLKNSQRSLGVGVSFSLETECIQKMLKKDQLLILSQYGSREICIFLAGIEFWT